MLTSEIAQANGVPVKEDSVQSVKANGHHRESNAQVRVTPFPKGVCKALVRAKIPDSFATQCLTRFDLQELGPIDIKLAREQQATYNETLRRIVGNMAEIPFAGEEHPDQVFVEDVVVVFRDTAIITRTGDESRRGEVDSMEEYLRKNDKHLKIKRMTAPATLDGGDVLFTGRHCFVGLSKRTNEAGVKFLADAIKHLDIPVTGVPIHDCPTLHLKCAASNLCAGVIMITENKTGRLIHETIRKIAGPDAYKFVFVPDELGANVLAIPDDNDPTKVKGVIVQDKFPKSQKIIRELMRERGEEHLIFEVDMSEIIKGDGSLTCGSVLLGRS